MGGVLELAFWAGKCYSQDSYLHHRCTVHNQSEDSKENESLVGDNCDGMEVDGRGRSEHEGTAVPLHGKWWKSPLSLSQ